MEFRRNFQVGSSDPWGTRNHCLKLKLLDLLSLLLPYKRNREYSQDIKWDRFLSTSRVRILCSQTRCRNF